MKKQLYISTYSSPTVAQLGNLSSLNQSLRTTIINGILKNVSNASVSNVTLRVPFGSFYTNGQLQTVGKNFNYLAYDGNSSIFNYTVEVIKATPLLKIEVNGAGVSAANTTQKIYVPILPGQKSYNLTVQLRSGNIYNNLNFSYQVLVGGRPAFGYNSRVSGMGINKAFTIYNLSTSENTSITLDSSGNANYTAVDPTADIIPVNIVYYVPINITNSQSSATAAPFQQMVVVNSTLYQQYEASNLQNILFFYTNGTLINSWLEGNILDQAQNTNLYTVSNTVYWLNLTNGIQATGSVTVFMGFAATSASVLDGVATGAAPNLWCASGCPQTSYAQYDNGAAVFPSYFNGDTSTSDFTAHAGYTVAQATGVTYGPTTVSAIKVSGSGSSSKTHDAQFAYNPGVPNEGFVQEMSYEPTSGSSKAFLGIGDSLSLGSIQNAVGMYASGTTADYEYISGGTGSHGSAVQPTVTENVWWFGTLDYLGPSGSSFSVGVSSVLYSSTLHSVAQNPLSSAASLYVTPLSQHTGTAAVSYYYNWARLRSYPPGGIMPSVNFGGTYGVSTFAESGLPLSGESWNVTYNGVAGNTIVPNGITFSSPPGNYPFTIQNQIVVGTGYTPNPQSGYLNSGNSITIGFSSSSLATSIFSESGLPPSDTWNVVYNGITQQSSSSTISFSGPPGAYNYYVSNQTYSGTLYTARPGIGNVTAGNTTAITFIPTYNLDYSDGKSTNTITTTSNQIFLLSHDHALKAVRIRLKTSSLSFNVVVLNQTGVFNGINPIPSTAYQYIQISGYVVGSSNSLDSYIKNVTYNFTVPASWLASHGISSGNLRVYKYISGLWSPLNTTYVAANALNYFYTAPSNSFSDYAIGYATGNALSTTNTIALTSLPSFPTYTYFFGIGSRLRGASGYNTWSVVGGIPWTVDVNKTITTSTRKFNASSIGHQTTSAATVKLAKAVGTPDSAIVGIGANVTFANGALYTITNTGTTKVKTLSLSYPVASANSFIILVFAASNSSFSAMSSGVPSGCTTEQEVTEAGWAAAGIITCTGVASSAGYSASVTTTRLAAISIAAYVFPPYQITFNDNPTTGTITAGGQTYTNGQTDLIIGTNTILANPPGGYTFNSWSVNNANITFNSLTANPAGFTVEGNGIITATYAQSASCQISLNSNTINFGTLIASHVYNTNQIVTDTNNGPTGAFIWVSGTDWAGGASNFGVGNTLWDATSDSSYTGTALGLVPSNTNLAVPGSGGSNSIYFGLGVPSGQAANTYTQNIIITNVC